MTRPARKFWQALIAFLVLPGMVAFVVPWWLHPRNRPFNAAGLLPFSVGVVLLLWCVRDFYIVGKGSLAPWAPPERLVIVGLYRFSRNPMYVAVLSILCGWALAFSSTTLWIYTAAIALMFHLRVVFGEEPWLASTHGEQFAAYKASVPRWLFTLRRRTFPHHPSGHAD